MDPKVGLAAAMAEYRQSLGEPEKRLLFACLDCLRAPPPDNGLQRPSIVEVAAFVLAQTRGVDKDTIAQTLAALLNTAPPAIPPAPTPLLLGQVGGASPVRAQKNDCPLRGTPLLDGQALSWGDRLKEMAIGADGNTSTRPLIRNHAQARQLFAEYASLEFRAVPDNNAADFPTDEAQQCALVTLIYDAIVDMSDILERKRPTSLKKANTSGTTCTASGGGGGSSGIVNQTQSTPAPAGEPTKPAKDTISVSKVKGLSRIEVWLLSWTILFSTHDIHRGRLPFLPWSKTDWGWDGSFGTFRQRLDAVVATLRRSKAAVCSLLESDYKARLESHPTREYRRKENNRAQNAERNAQVFVGRHTLVTRKMIRSADGDLCDHEGNIVAPGDDSHNELIEQTIVLNQVQMRARGQKNKRASPELDGDGQPKPKRALAAARRRAKKTEPGLDSSTQSTFPAPAPAPKAIMPKPACAMPDASPAAILTPADMNLCDPSPPAEPLSPSDILAPVAYMACASDLGIKSGDDTDDEWVLTAPADLPTSSPDLAQLMGLPTQNSCPVPSLSHTASQLPEEDVSLAEMAALFGTGNGTLDGVNDLNSLNGLNGLNDPNGPNGFNDLNGLNGLNYGLNPVPAGYFGTLNNLYNSDSGVYTLYNAGLWGGMDTLNGITPFDVPMQTTSSLDVDVAYGGDAVMDNAYSDNSSLLPMDGGADDLSSSLLMNLTLEGAWLPDGLPDATEQ